MFKFRNRFGHVMYNSSSQNIITYLEDSLIHNENYEKLFKSLNEKFKPKELIECYKYILENKTDADLLTVVIREINKTKYFDCMHSLLDFIKKDFNDNSYFDIKVLAIKTVSNYQNKACVPVLLDCLNNKNSNYKIRLASAEALGKIGDKNAFDSLSSIAGDEAENSAYIKESAVVALGMLGDSRALDIFDSILKSKQMFLDKFSYLKERILEAIAKLNISKDKKALDILKKSLMDTSVRVRISAIDAIQNADFDCAYELIYDRLLYDDNIEVKKNALIALYNISDRKILDEVISGNFDMELKYCAEDIIKENENE